MPITRRWWIWVPPAAVLLAAWVYVQTPSGTAPNLAGEISERSASQSLAPGQSAEPSRVETVRESVPRQREVIGQPDASRSPAQLLKEYASLPLPDRVATLRYLSAAESWSEAERAALLDTMLRDPVAELRMAALMQVEEEYFPSALPSLNRALTDPSEEVRTMAISALGGSGDPQAAASLSRALFDLAPDLRTLALEVSASFEETVRRPIILRALESPDDDLASTAVHALWDVLSPEVVAPVIRLLDSPSEVRREAANQFLSALTGERFESRREADLWWQANRTKFEAEQALAAQESSERK